MAGPRKFDHDKARARRAAGESVASLAERYGVTETAIRVAVDARARLRYEMYQAQRQRSVCGECGDPCSWNPSQQEAPRCRACHAKARATTVRFDGLLCLACREWKWDSEFPWSRAEPHRRGRHNSCRACQTKLRRDYRNRHKVPCVRCGAPALPPSEKSATSTDFARCRPCYEADRKAARADTKSLTGGESR